MLSKMIVKRTRDAAKKVPPLVGPTTKALPLPLLVVGPLVEELLCGFPKQKFQNRGRQMSLFRKEKRQ